MEIDKTFKTLYKKTSTGAIQQWSIKATNINNIACIVSNYGQVGGKIQESIEQVLQGKNEGKANETTAYEQAISQAESTWKKQLKKGYVDNIEDILRQSLGAPLGCGGRKIAYRA